MKLFIKCVVIGLFLMVGDYSAAEPFITPSMMEHRSILVSNYPKNKADKMGTAFEQAIQTLGILGVQVAVISPKIQEGDALLESQYLESQYHSKKTHRALVLYVTPPNKDLSLLYTRAKKIFASE